MKIPVVLVAVAAALVCTSASAETISTAEQTCLTECQVEIMAFQMQDCAPWRERLPRPDLFSLCQDGFDLGVSAGCEGYCKEPVHEDTIASLRLDACTFLRGTPPKDRMRACQNGFTSAVHRAKDTNAAEKRRYAPKDKLDKLLAPISMPTAEDLVPAAVAKDSDIPATVAKDSDETGAKKTFTVKKAPELRNILEQAREEAQAAFNDIGRAQRATKE